LAGSRDTFGENGYWYALRWNKVAKRFDMNYVSPFFTAGISAVRLGNPHSSAGNEIVVAEKNGNLNLYSQSTKRRLHTFRTSLTSITAIALKDLNSDGLDEILAVGDNGLAAYTGQGSKLWQITGVSGSDLTVGQMDADSSLEVALTDGNVIDIASQTVQWKRSAGFGRHLQNADIDNDGKNELIAAEAWYIVGAFDVDKKLPKWSISTDLDIGAINVTDIDKDGIQELIIGDGQWGNVYAVNTVTKEEEWSIQNPEHGVTNIAVGDVNNDGVEEVFWGAGYSSTGPDYLYVGNWQTKSVSWQSQDLDGPFVKPAVGDVDGDGKPELVVGTFSSNSGYDSGRILLFDGYTLALKAMSKPIANSSSWTGMHDLKLRNVTAHPGNEILVASDWLYDGLVEIYSFSSGNFTKVWTNNARPEGSPFYSVEIADVDGDEKRELVLGAGREHTGAAGVFVYLYDLATKNEIWHSFQLGGYWDHIADVVVGDFDKDGGLDFGGLVYGGEFGLFDGKTKETMDLLTTKGTQVRLGSRAALPPNLIVDDQAGGLDYYRYQKATNTFGVVKHVVLDSAAISGFRFNGPGNIWYGINGVLKNKDLIDLSLLVQTLNYGPGLGKNIAYLPGTKYGDLVIAAGPYGVFGFLNPSFPSSSGKNTR
jgi:hypothetical protein